MILLTAMAEQTARTVGLETSADDDLLKPSYPYKLLARIRAVLCCAPAPLARVAPGRQRFAGRHFDPAVLSLAHIESRRGDLTSDTAPAHRDFPLRP